MSTPPAESYRVALNKVTKLTQALAGPDASTTYAAALAELSEALAALDNPAPPQSEEADEAALPDLRASRDEARKERDAKREEALAMLEKTRQLHAISSMLSDAANPSTLP